jgi:hypothetical protein
MRCGRTAGTTRTGSSLAPYGVRPRTDPESMRGRRGKRVRGGRSGGSAYASTSGMGAPSGTCFMLTELMQ